MGIHKMIEVIQGLVKSGFTGWDLLGNVKVTYRDNLVLFNYMAQTNETWNELEQISRGLILNTGGNIVARPFDKFWNWLEGGRTSSGHIVTVTEKVDGSLGILYRDNGYKIATRGSFESEQAIWATNHLANYNLEGLPGDLTLLFEIVYPENRIVVDYGDTEALYLLAARKFTGEYLPFYPDVYELGQRYGFPLPRVYQFNNVTAILEALEGLTANSEGWVVEFSDGQRFKFKGDRYLELHRIVTGASFKRVLNEVANGTFGGMIQTVPDELLGQIMEWKEEIDQTVQRTIDLVEVAWHNAPKTDRKTFALWSKGHCPKLSPYLFRKLDRKDYLDLIYRIEFKGD